MEFSLWKQLKRRLRRRRPLWTLGSFMICLFAGIFIANQTAASAAVLAEPLKSDLIETLAEQTKPLPVVLQRVYVCGEEIRPLGTMDTRSIIELLRTHPEWSANMDKNGEVKLVEQVNDLSEACKQNSFFSLDKLGNLSLFEGPPKKEKVIRTFFQLDVHYMESSLPKKQLEALTRGIRITDIAEYNSVISTFSEFALEPSSEKVMLPSYYQE
ncbi:BofC C-terminal domain-containing protein [Paenibacillus abyssi]|uniref:Bypass of forespore C C-terminal domain-containing protein n=1 Tax=Paenibacillus abyssi TaxID=1340531 RepID=A0A917LGA4_9BACL|nr:BofC C-terminal domain-containing protein [Paenibacillus abyssi]GGG20185.1 hypothetical protein GCM10010916_41180 [Paenibacillus abyssi]